MKRIFLVLVIFGLLCGYAVLRRPGAKDEAERLSHEAGASSPVVTSAAVPVGPVTVEVFGAVRSPGKIKLDRPSLADALTRTVPYILSDLKRVRVYRMESGVRVKDTVVDATDIQDPGSVDVPLGSGDTVFVPEKIL